MSKAAASSGQKQVREKTNWLIHMLYVRQDYDKCLTTIEEVLKECKGMAEYPIYVKALIKRQRGEIQESLQLFQAATCLNPHNIANLKQVGRSLYLLARHKCAPARRERRPRRALPARVLTRRWRACAPCAPGRRSTCTRRRCASASTTGRFGTTRGCATCT